MGISDRGKCTGYFRVKEVFSIDNLKYPYSDIEKLLGYSFDVGCKEFDIMPIDELINYLKDGWVIYYESGKTDKEIKCLALVKVHQKE